MSLSHKQFAFGLNNPNTLCYFNSLMQALLSCPAPLKYILDSDNANANANACWVSFRTFMLAAVSKTPPTTALPIITALQAAEQSQFGRGQEDAGEGFHLLLDHMANDEYASKFMHKYEHDIYCPQCKKIVSSKVDSSFHLEIPPNYTDDMVNWEDDSDIKYTSKLNQYMRHHVTVLNDFKCPSCKLTNRMIRLSHLILVPDVLVVQFNKFAGKFNSPYPTELVFPSTHKSKTLQFKLVAKIDHFGSMGGGHYIAHGMRGDRIYTFNDSSVSSGSFDVNPNTYLCFYHMI